MEDFPTRVTLYEDGVYRWCYDMDLWRNRYMIGLMFKLLGIILGLPTLFTLAMLLRRLIPLLGRDMPREDIQFYIHGDLLAFAVVGGLFVGTILLALIIYAICAAVMGGTYRVRFTMDESTVMLVRDPNYMKALNTFGGVIAVAGLVLGKPGDSLRIGSTLAVANNTGTSRFDSVRRIKRVPKYDVLDLREWFGMNQIYVSPEDYDFVLGFILERVPEKARLRSKSPQ